ncbi:hypothetical protein [Paraburkholderia caribensis]|uniref:hypothetical protein n=1 Tax=Paraburkholderia caribensis TaxID=75105 RepID=UPI0012E8550B|nr:hypothetical protein [Paraburkholderia caribensis]
MQPFVADVAFKCPVCNGLSHNVIHLPPPQWDLVTNLSQIGGETEAELICSNCNSRFTATATYSGLDALVSLTDFPQTSVQTGAAGYLMSFDGDFWVSAEASVNPHQIFVDSYHQTGDILAEHGGPDGTDLVNRMVFVQQFGALEAYLGDTLVNHVLSDTKAIARLIGEDQTLRGKAFGLAELLDAPDIVHREVKSYLKSVLYHRLDQVTSLYRVALDINIWPSSVVRSKLFRAVAFRHDCVHRNGYTLEGAKLDIFTKDWVEEIADATKAVVDFIEGNFAPRALTQQKRSL